MATQAYICRVRTDLPAGAVQITDLQPNTSQRSYVYQPVGQSGYCPPLHQSDTVAGYVAALATTKILNGLAAWVADTICDDSAGTNLGFDAGDADSAATAIFAAAQPSALMGGPLDAPAVNTAISTVNAASGIGLGTSVGTLLEVLRILSGEVYSVPAGTTVNPALAFKGAADGAFDATASEARGVRGIYATGALQISCGAGVLSVLGSASFNYVVGGSSVAGAAVAVFLADGTLLNG